MNHYAKEELDRYLHQDINFLTRQKVKKHLASCETCKAVLEELQEDDKLLEDIRSLKKEAVPEGDSSDKAYTELSSILGEA